MSDEQVLERLGSVLSKMLGHDNFSLERETIARHVNGWTSLNHLEVIRSAEAEFGIKIVLPEIMRMKNIGDLVDIIKSKAE